MYVVFNPLSISLSRRFGGETEDDDDDDEEGKEEKVKQSGLEVCTRRISRTEK